MTRYSCLPLPSFDISKCLPRIKQYSFSALLHPCYANDLRTRSKNQSGKCRAANSSSKRSLTVNACSCTSEETSTSIAQGNQPTSHAQRSSSSASRKGKDYTYLYGAHVGTGGLTPYVDSAFDVRVDR